MELQGMCTTEELMHSKNRAKNCKRCAQQKSRCIAKKHQEKRFSWEAMKRSILLGIGCLIAPNVSPVCD